MGAEQKTYTIRHTTLDDIPSMRRMQAQSWIDTYPNDDEGISEEWVRNKVTRWRTPEALEESKEFIGKVLADPLQFHRVAVAGGEVVGFIHATKGNNRQEWDGLYVDKAFHGSGLAQELVALADDWLDLSKPTYLTLARYNGRARRFYEKYGFRYVPGTDDMHDLLPVVTMERKGENL